MTREFKRPSEMAMSTYRKTSAIWRSTLLELQSHVPTHHRARQRVRTQVAMWVVLMLEHDLFLATFRGMPSAFALGMPRKDAKNSSCSSTIVEHSHAREHVIDRVACALAPARAHAHAFGLPL